MELNWLTHLEALAICFASCGVILMLTVYFIVRTATETPGEGGPEARPPAPVAVDLENLRLEGFELLDIYDDAQQWRSAVERRGLTSERVVRTAKIRDPHTGAVSLIKVHTLVRPW